MERRRVVAAAASKLAAARSFAPCWRRSSSRRRSRGRTTAGARSPTHASSTRWAQVCALESVTTRVSGFDQFGHGYQAQGGPTPTSPGSERLTVFEPQAEVVISQGDRITHRLWIPVDVVTNASPDAIDVMSSASRHVEGGIDRLDDDLSRQPQRSSSRCATACTSRTRSARGAAASERAARSRTRRRWSPGACSRSSTGSTASTSTGTRHGHTDRNGTTGSSASRRC